MNILVTNDDGLSSEGIRVLASVLGETHSVWVVAPSCNRSGVSHGITLFEPLRFVQESERVFSCSGFPADCSITGISGIMSQKPDVVVSGINKGANLGTDILYSGTAAAARQAAIEGIPGIAVSLVSDSKTYIWEPLARFIAKNLLTLIALCSPDVFVNVNAPSLFSYKGAKMTSISRRTYRDSILMHDGSDGCKYSDFIGGVIQSSGDEDSDYLAVDAGYVSITCVTAQPVVAPSQNQVSPCFIV